jgi:hypothetical protein
MFERSQHMSTPVCYDASYYNIAPPRYTLIVRNAAKSAFSVCLMSYADASPYLPASAACFAHGARFTPCWLLCRCRSVSDVAATLALTLHVALLLPFQLSHEVPRRHAPPRSIFPFMPLFHVIRYRIGARFCRFAFSRIFARY